MTSEICGATELRPKGSLALSPARELIALRSVPGAYRPDGQVAEDTLRRWWGGSLRAAGRLPRPAGVAPSELVGTTGEPVLWGGGRCLLMAIS
jgi:hypothetical protein